MSSMRAFALATTVMIGCGEAPLPVPAAPATPAPTIETKAAPPPVAAKPTPTPAPSACERALAEAESQVPRAPSPSFPIVFDDNDRHGLPSFVDSFDDDAFREGYEESKARLLFLVAMEGTRPNEIAAALKGLAHHFSYRVDAKVLGALGLELTEARRAFDQVVLRHLDSREPKVRRYALEAAKVSADRARPEPQLVTAILRAACAEGDPGRRMGGLRALGELRSYRADVEDVVLAEALLATEPEVLAAALEVLYQASGQVQDRMLFPERVAALLDHERPAIRGLAARGLHDLVDGDVEKRAAIAKLLPLFDDPHPFVRVSATEALVRMDVQHLIHRIVKRIDRDEPCAIDVHYRESDGASAKIELDPCSHDLEGVAYLSALDWISLGTDHRFEVSIDYRHPAADIARLRKAAPLWYEQHKDAYPPAPTHEKGADVLTGS